MRYPPGATKAFKKQLMLEAAVHRGVMKKRPCVLTGALAPLGASFFERDWEGRATLELPLVAWRVGGGPVRLAALTAYLHGPRAAMLARMRGCPGGAVVRARVRLAEKTALGTGRAAIVKLEGRVVDKELAAVVAAQKPPARAVHAGLGVFRAERGGGAYAGRAPWCGRPVRVTIEACTKRELAEGLAALERLVGEQRATDSRVRRAVLEQLLRLARRWNEDDGAAPTRAGLKRALKLKEISVHAGRGSSFSYDPGPAFGGHDAVLSVGARGAIGEVD